jgi:DNA-binding transcriptional regulator GbsR (MarR family)
MALSAPVETFVRHWGEMGARWGVNRSVAQIHALLYLSDVALPADEIADVLGIARSNASNGLKELQGFQLIELVHLAEDRRDHFRAKQDPWDMLMAIVEERKRREIDPALAMVRACSEQASKDRATSAGARARIKAMLDLLTQLDGFYAQVRRLSRPALKRVVNLGDKLMRIV